MNAFEKEIDQFESRQAEELRAQAREARQGLLKSAGFYITHLLRHQIQTQMNTNKGDIVDFKVTRDHEHAPRGIGHICLAFMKEGQNTGLQRRERLRVLVPTPGGFDDMALEQIDRLARPDEIYTERLRYDDETDKFVPYARCIVTPYYNMIYTLDELDMEEQMQHPNFDQMLSGRVSEELSLLGRLQEDLVNWQVVPQRRTIEGEGPVVNL